MGFLSSKHPGPGNVLGKQAELIHDVILHVSQKSRAHSRMSSILVGETNDTCPSSRSQISTYVLI